MGGRTFDCLDAVINRYRTEQIVEGTEFYRVLPSFTEFLQGQLIFSTLVSDRSAFQGVGSAHFPSVNHENLFQSSRGLIFSST